VFGTILEIVLSVVLVVGLFLILFLKLPTLPPRTIYRDIPSFRPYEAPQHEWHSSSTVSITYPKGTPIETVLEELEKLKSKDPLWEMDAEKRTIKKEKTTVEQKTEG